MIIRPIININKELVHLRVFRILSVIISGKLVYICSNCQSQVTDGDILAWQCHNCGIKVKPYFGVAICSNCGEHFNTNLVQCPSCATPQLWI
jgi:DNA-directed RNA polymerase subunit RPC12/RpoP